MGAAMTAVTSSRTVWGWRRSLLLAVAAVSVSACSGAGPADDAASATPSPAGPPSAPAEVASDPAASDAAGAPDVAVPPASELLPPDVTDLSSEQMERLREELDRALEEQREEIIEDLPVPELPSEVLDDVLRP